MDTLLAEAKDFVASRAVACPQSAAQPAPWDEWAQIAAVLRSQNTRQDQHGQPCPMTSEEVSQWLKERNQRARRYSDTTMRSRLSPRVKRLS